MRLFFISLFLLLGAHLFADKVGLLIVATGRYDVFVDPLIASARQHFCPNHQVTYYVFTDGVISPASDVVQVFQRRVGWPFDTLMRNSMYLQNKELFKDEDYLFALDADMLFLDTVGDEILGERVATLHPGYTMTGSKPTYETNPKSAAFVQEGEASFYFAGGFFGGSQREFIKLIAETSSRIQKDLDNGIIAIWHDESHWNRYCIDYPPQVILSPSYCFAENISEMGFSEHVVAEYKKMFPRKLLALTKKGDYRSATP
jgi:histo-blood group ABO system transferase